MEFEQFSYRFAEEIMTNSTNMYAYQEIISVIENCPLFLFPNKSSKTPRLDIVQQLMNTYFDRCLACDHSWSYHPAATRILNSGLAADFRKDFNGLRIQAEVQFGNMSRWYSDIFKFQTAYSQDLIDLGLCIVPMASMASRMDSNVANYERCLRELPSAKLSITLPILIIGLREDSNTLRINVPSAGITDARNIKTFTGGGATENRYRIVNGILNNIPIDQINDQSDAGPMASLFEPEDQED
jgi:hypothetical protein